MEKSCGCKGCRSCLYCENPNSKKNKTVSEEDEVLFHTFYYDHAYGYCLSQMDGNKQMLFHGDSDQQKNTLIGFDFPGVAIVSNFLSAVEESELVNKIDGFPWKNSQSGRCKQDYGPKVNFKKQKIKFASFTGLPSYIATIVNRMKNVSKLKDFDIVEQCNLEYLPERGSHIEPHFDDEWLWGERLVTLNLLSDTWFTMTCASDEKCTLKAFSRDITTSGNILKEIVQHSLPVVDEGLTYNTIKVKIPLNRCSLVILSGTARSEWKHAIERQDITSRRLCCTFRELSALFGQNGDKRDIGRELLTIASTFNGSVVL